MRRVGPLTSAAVLLPVLLAGCAADAPKKSVEHIPPVDRMTLDTMGEHVVDESAKLAAAQDGVREKIEKTSPPPVMPAAAPVYDPLEDKVVSVKMMDAPVGQLLWALGDQLGMNLLVDPQVLALDKRANIHLHNVTARELFNSITRAFDVHGEAQGNTLVVNLMQEKVIDIDVLNTKMSVSIASGGNVFGANTGGGGNGGGGGGSGQIKGDFSLSGDMGEQTSVYEQLEAGLKRMLGDTERSGDAQAAQDAQGKTKEPKPIYSLNRMTGTLYVRARPSQVKAIENMVDRFKSVLRRQVLIEAQLIDLELSDDFEFGVDWTLLRRHVAGVYGANPINLQPNSVQWPSTMPIPMQPQTLTFPAQTVGAATGRALGLAYGNDSFTAALNLLRSFGSVRVLSNPSIRARNGTPAFINVGTNSRYISKTSLTVTNPGGGASTSTADVQTDAVFSGVIVGVVPYIRENGVVELLVHPMQTDVDPASLQLTDVGGGSRVSLPVVNFKGMTTTLSLHDGDIVMLGGLIDQKTGSTNRGLPGVSDIPVFGKAFDQENSSHKSRELVVVLKVKVL